MDKQKILEMIDDHKNKLIDPVEMLNWVWLRVFINQIPDEDFHRYMEQTAKVCSL
jgi:hypothetical protein